MTISGTGEEINVRASDEEKSGMIFLLLCCEAERQCNVNVHFIVIISRVYSFKAAWFMVYYTLGNLNEQSGCLLSSLLSQIVLDNNNTQQPR